MKGLVLTTLLGLAALAGSSDAFAKGATETPTCSFVDRIDFFDGPPAAGRKAGDPAPTSMPVCGYYPQQDGDQPSAQPIKAYLGMRYARAARWQPPEFALPGLEPASRYDNTGGNDQIVDALNFKTVCPQKHTGDFPRAKSDKETREGVPIGDDDCLFLNIYKSGDASAAPVMVFIHGGAFIEGSGGDGAIIVGGTDPSRPEVIFNPDQALYSGVGLIKAAERQQSKTPLANGGKGLVVVTLNYRLGALGFLYHDAEDSPVKSYGNYGILDQRKALEWVQANIRQFGGDPGNVTVFGESAGAMSVGLHIFNTAGGGSLFHRAIMESNPIGLPYRQNDYRTKDDKLILGEVNAESCRLVHDAYEKVAGDETVLKNCDYAGRQPIGALHFDYAKGFAKLTASTGGVYDVPAAVIADAQLALLPTITDMTAAGGGKRWFALLPWTPFVGDEANVLFPGQPLEQGFYQGTGGTGPRANPVPVLMGTNRDEADLFIGMIGQPLAITALYSTAMNALLSDARSSNGKANPALSDLHRPLPAPVADADVQPYCGLDISVDKTGMSAGAPGDGGLLNCPTGTTGTSGFVAATDSILPDAAYTGPTAFGRVGTDLVFRCGNVEVARSIAKQNTTPNQVGMYLFSGSPVANSAVFPGKLCNNGNGQTYQSVCHGYELPAVFSTFGHFSAAGSGATPWTITSMTSAWANFATTSTLPGDAAPGQIPLALYPAADGSDGQVRLPPYSTTFQHTVDGMAAASSCDTFWTPQAVYPTWRTGR